MSGAELASVLVSVTAVAAAAFATLVLALQRHRTQGAGSAKVTWLEVEPVGLELLLDQRSCFQYMLQVVSQALEQDQMQAHSALRVVRLIESSPEIIFNEVLSDREYAGLESRGEFETLWIISCDESIEFFYPGLQGLFSDIVIENLKRGRNYRYLVPDSIRTRKRADEVRATVERLLDGFTGARLGDLEVRMVSKSYIDRLRERTDEFLVMESRNTKSPALVYYQFPGTSSRQWVRAPAADAAARLADAKAMWTASEPAGRDANPA